MAIGFEDIDIEMLCSCPINKELVTEVREQVLNGVYTLDSQRAALGMIEDNLYLISVYA